MGKSFADRTGSGHRIPVSAIDAHDRNVFADDTANDGITLLAWVSPTGSLEHAPPPMTPHRRPPANSSPTPRQDKPLAGELGDRLTEVCTAPKRQELARPERAVTDWKLHAYSWTR